MTLGVPELLSLAMCCEKVLDFALAPDSCTEGVHKKNKEVFPHLLGIFGGVLQKGTHCLALNSAQVTH